MNYSHERSSITSNLKRILLLGSTGQTGFELQRSLALMGTLITPCRNDIDLTDTNSLRRYIQTVQPNLIVNAAAWTDVDAAEEQPEKAYILNAHLPAILAEYASVKRILLVHYSTDYVYPGSGDKPWKETDSPDPLSIYGKTKLEGDKAIESSGASYLIFRTSWVYSTRGRNFMNTILDLGTKRDSLKIIGDQTGAPTPTRLIAEITLLVLQEWRRRHSIKSGIYHLAPRGKTSWYGFAQAIFKYASRNGMKLAIRPEDITEISTKEWPTLATRPLNSCLSLTRIEQALNICMPHWESQLALTLAEQRISK